MSINSHLGVEVVVKPERELFSANNEEENTTYRVLACAVVEDNDGLIKLNDFGNIVISGDNLDELAVDVPRKVYLTPSVSQRYKDGYTARIPVDPIPDNSKDQWTFLSTVISEKDMNAFKQEYSIDDKIIEIILDNENATFLSRNIVGYGIKRLEKLKSKIMEREEYARTYVILSDLDMTDNMIQKIYKKYLSEIKIKNILENNIYQFTEVTGIGFKTIDEIYLAKEESSKEDENRIISGLYYYLEENQSNGNTRVEKRKLIQGTTSLLGVPLKLIRECLERESVVVELTDIYNIPKILDKDNEETKGKDIILFNDKYSTRISFMTEWRVFEEIVSRSMEKPHLVEHDMDKMVDDFEKEEGFALSDEQRQFFLDLFESSVSFLSGNSGSGKTTSQKLMLQYAKETGQSIVFLAPTGRARKKLAEYTGHKAYTIHSFVNSELAIESYNIYFIDESSMVDVGLALKLFKCIPEGCKVVFAGDDSQIPSVAYGNFLYDSLNNETTFVNKYTKIFRQDEGGILDIVTKIRFGIPFLPNSFRGRKQFGNNCVFDMRKPETGKDITDQAVTAYLNVMNTKKYGLDDVAILSPTKKGIKGTTSVNKKIQEHMNPYDGVKQEFASISNGIDVVFREGDLVMNQKNHKELLTYYEMGGSYLEDGEKTSIVNGDIGIILKISEDKKEIYIKFDDGIVRFISKDFNSGMIIHAWCITGHKSQGSEYKVVICLVDSSSSYQMNGNLLYTMCSRAKELLLVLGDPLVINRSLKKFENLERETNLLDFFKINDYFAREAKKNGSE